MPALLAFLASAFSEIFVWFAKYWTVKVAVFAAAASLIGVAYLAFDAVYLSALDALSLSLPTGQGWDIAFSCLPPNLPTCASIVSTVASAKWVFGNIKALIELSAQVKS